MSDQTIDSPIINSILAREKTAPATATLLDAAKPMAAAPPMQPTTEAPARLAHEMPSIGQFFAQNKAVVDERRHELARVGMLPEHARALAMPDLTDAPLAPAVVIDRLPEANRMKLAMPASANVTDEAPESAYRGRSDAAEE